MTGLKEMDGHLTFFARVILSAKTKFPLIRLHDPIQQTLMSLQYAGSSDADDVEYL